MSNEGTRDDRPVELRDETVKPALGVIATETNTPELVKTLFEAREQGYDVLVTYYDSETIAVDLIERLGGQIVDPDKPYPDAESLRRKLIQVAREHGYSGVILLREIDEQINFERSVSALNKSATYAIEASTGSTDPQDNPGEVLVAIPAYNEEQSIASVVRKARTVADVVLVVDDGSSDESAARAAEAGAVIVQHEHNKGYGAALKTAFREAHERDVDHLVVLDGDGQHDVTDVPKLVEVQRDSGAEIVVGSRGFSNGANKAPIYRRFGLLVINRLMSWSLRLLGAGFRIRDTQSGFRVYSAEAIRTLAADESISDGMDASLDIIFHSSRQGYDIKETETTIRYGDETNTHDPVSHGLQLVKQIVETTERERPIVLLGIPGLLSAFVGFVIGYWTISALSPPRVPVLGVAAITALLTLVGLLVSVAGVVLHSFNVYFDNR